MRAAVTARIRPLGRLGVLALAYLRYRWVGSLILMLTVAVVFGALWAGPQAIRSVEKTLVARAETSGLIAGPAIGATELTLGIAYFASRFEKSLTFGDLEPGRFPGAQVYPVDIRHRRGAMPIVGVTAGYFDMRGTVVESGRVFASAGEAVAGAGAARAFGLAPGNPIVTTPEGLFDFTAPPPVRLTVVGRLAPTGTPDDDVIFVDLATVWVMDGRGHAHEEAAAGHAHDPDAARNRAAGLSDRRPYIDATDAGRFHFHGEAAGFPVSGAVVIPGADWVGPSLLARAEQAAGSVTLADPVAVVRDIVGRLSRIERLTRAIALGFAALMTVVLALIVGMNVKIRADDFATMRDIGAGRGQIAAIVALETAIVAAAGIGLSVPLVWGVGALVARSGVLAGLR